MPRRLLSLLLPVLLLAALACEEAPPPELRGAPVVLSSVELRDLVERIEAPGELLAKNRAVIAAEVAGQVTEIAVDEGGAVAPQAVVIEIDPERRRLEIADARARLAEAGLESVVMGDPAHSVAPHHVTERVFQLVVMDEVAAQARSVLTDDVPADAEADALDEAYHQRRFADRPVWVRRTTVLLLVTFVGPIAVAAFFHVLWLLRGLFP